MKQLLLLGMSLLAVAACSPPSPPPAVPGQPITPVSYALGSPANTTRSFDGTYTPWLGVRLPLGPVRLR